MEVLKVEEDGEVVKMVEERLWWTLNLRFHLPLSFCPQTNALIPLPVLVTGSSLLSPSLEIAFFYNVRKASSRIINGHLFCFKYIYDRHL